MRQKSIVNNVLFGLSHILFPLALGFCIYVIFRLNQSLMMFEWFRSFGMDDLLVAINQIGIPLRRYSPNFINENLPDAIWVYTGTAFFLYFWRHEAAAYRMIWGTFCVILAVGSEILQGLEVLPGQFDFWDIVAYLLAFLAAYYSVTPNPKLEEENAT